LVFTALKAYVAAKTTRTVIKRFARRASRENWLAGTSFGTAWFVVLTIANGMPYATVVAPNPLFDVNGIMLSALNETTDNTVVTIK
jgi:hypothetical protein